MVARRVLGQNTGAPLSLLTLSHLFGHLPLWFLSVRYEIQQGIRGEAWEDVMASLLEGKALGWEVVFARRNLGISGF